MRHLSAALGVAVALVAGSAGAVEPRDAAAAEALFQRAKQLSAQGENAQACAFFAESQRLDPAAGTLLNLASCEEALGKLASAWQHFVDARAGLAAGDYRLSFAEKRIQALEGLVPRLTITLAAAGGDVANVRVFRDDIELGKPSLGVALPTDPGKHVLVVRAAGRVDERTEIVLANAESKTVELRIGAPALASSDDSAREPTDGSRRTVGYVVGGAGALSLGVGIVAGFITMDAASRYKNNCDADGACNPQGLDAASTGKTFGVVSPVALGVGVIALAVGAYLVLSAPKRTGVSTAVVARGSSVGWETRF